MVEGILIISDAARILIVRTGNICRSPFIERLLRHQVDQRRPGSDPGVIVRSADTGAMVGSPRDAESAAQLVAYGGGGDPSGFSARDITPALIAESDLVLTATRAHSGKVALMSPRHCRVFTFCDSADLVSGIDGHAAPHPNGSAWLVKEVTERAAASRGLRPPLALASADIVDPYWLEDEV